MSIRAKSSAADTIRHHLHHSQLLLVLLQVALTLRAHYVELGQRLVTRCPCLLQLMTQRLRLLHGHHRLLPQLPHTLPRALGLLAH